MVTFLIFEARFFQQVRFLAGPFFSDPGFPYLKNVFVY